MDFLKRAGEYFKNHLSVHKFHFTSDGMAFHAKSDAEAHARTLNDPEVKTILRADVEVGDEVVPKTEGDPEAEPDVDPGETTPENKDNNPEPEQLTGSTPATEADKAAKDSNKAKGSKK